MRDWMHKTSIFVEAYRCFGDLRRLTFVRDPLPSTMCEVQEAAPSSFPSDRKRAGQAGAPTLPQYKRKNCDDGDMLNLCDRQRGALANICAMFFSNPW